MSETASSKVLLHFGPYAFTVRAHPIHHPVTVSTREVCEVDGQPISYLHICPDCEGIVQESVMGTSAPAPIKQRFCTNQRCGKQVEGKVETMPFCTKCKSVLSEDKIEDAYNYGGGLFRISAEQYAALKALRLSRGIYVIRALNADQQPSLRYVRETMELRSGETDGDVEGFRHMVASAKRQHLSFAAFSVLRQEQAHQTFVYENGALIQFEPDGVVLLAQLHGEHECKTSKPETISESDLSELLLDDTVALHQALTDPVRAVDWLLYAATPGTRAFHGLLAATKEGKSFEIPKPTPLPDKATIVANRLVEHMSERVKQIRQARRAAKKAAEAQAEPVAAASASGNDNTPTGEANPTA